MNEETNLVRHEQADTALSPSSRFDAMKEYLVQRVQFIQDVKNEVLERGKNAGEGDYNNIPGCGDRLVLLKSGAEKLCLAFELSPKYTVLTHIHRNDHVAFQVTCDLLNKSGNIVGSDWYGWESTRSTTLGS